MSIPDGFSKHNDVWNNTIIFKAPEVCSYPPISGLHFIRNTNTSRGTYPTIDFPQIIFWQENLPAHARHRLSDETAQTMDTNGLNNFIDVLCILLCSFGLVGLVATTIQIRQRNVAYPRRCAVASRSVVFIRTDVDQGVSVSVVGMIQDDEVLRARLGSCESQSKFIRFAS